jgi:hypothetical protein
VEKEEAVRQTDMKQFEDARGANKNISLDQDVYLNPYKDNLKLEEVQKRHEMGIRWTRRSRMKRK